MVMFHLFLVLSSCIFLIASQDIEDPKGDDNFINGNSSSYHVQYKSSQVMDDDVVFVAFNKKNPEGTYLSLNTSESELKSILQKNKETTFITHGWLGSENGSYVTDIRIAYMEKTDMNVIVVGWSKISRNEYVTATFGVSGVGTIVGRMVSNLLHLGLVELESVHLVGHSLGAHVMGNAGGYIRDAGLGKVARITGLDPAKPGYEGISNENVRLDIGDGQFVDVIHTSIGVFGYVAAIGHADFYPNGGYNNQPGCTLTIRIFCSHIKALVYFKESIYNEQAFPSVKCDSYSQFRTNRCEGNEVVYMGEPTPSSARGTYYLQTNNNRMLDGNDEEMAESIII